ncbi:MAG: phosphoribosylformylglycinamidine synthase, purS protein [Bdellovibrio sp. 28-41-41]|nr:MAG: phosphoribosylformylglycinamidine synthase, purS protein [Bdellovibrio sp. 28-41-41]
MKWGIKILPREVLLDTQGRAVQDYLNQTAQTVNQCRIGKYIVLDLKQTDSAESKKKAIEITEQTLINPLIETYTIESL